MVKITGIEAEMKRLRDGIKEFEKEAISVMRDATMIVLAELFANTPVWSGETVRNYAVGVGSKPGGGTKGFIGGAPEATSNKPMGSENNRGANEAAALSDASTAVSAMTKLQSVYITNLVDGAKWDLIDSGNAPEPGRARNPGGVSKLAEMNAKAALSQHFR